MAKVIPIGTPVNEGERRTIAHLRDQLPDDYTIIHNFEIKRDQQTFEVDIALIAPHALYVIDVKGTRGTIEVQGPNWYPEGRRPFRSPLPKLREHAKVVKGFIADAHPTSRDLEKIFVVETIVLCAPDAYLVDPRGRDEDHVCTLKKAERFFRSKALLPQWASVNIKPFHRVLLKAITGGARARTGPLVFGNWEVIERIGSTDLYVEYRACNATTGRRADTVNLRVYQADPYAEEEQRKKQQNRIQNAYESLCKLPSHKNIAAARDFFVNEHEDQYILVTDDMPGKALQLLLTRPTLALTTDEKWRVTKEALSALAHAHGHGVVHRNITPTAIMVGKDGVARLVDFDFARSKQDRTNTIADEITDALSPQYMAPECFQDASAATAASDVYSLGIVVYEMLTGERPFASLTEAFDQSARFPVPPSKSADWLPQGIDEWLQGMCAFVPDERPTSAEALARLESILVPVSDTGEAGLPTAAPRPIKDIDYNRLPVDHLIAGKYTVKERLGAGSYGVAYRVYDSLADATRVMKLTLKDRHSIIDRFKREYRLLDKLPAHPYVVRVIDGNILPGEDIPYLVFEFVEGDELQSYVEKGALTPQESLDFAVQVADGLDHIHRNGVYHCDIKPGNLLWTPTGAKIIDFNVAVKQVDLSHGGGSRKYLPPDLDLAVPPSGSCMEDRDCFALCITLYQALSGNNFPWKGDMPLPTRPEDIRQWPGCGDLSDALVDVLNKALSPQRSQRYANAADLLHALRGVKEPLRPKVIPTDVDTDTRAGRRSDTTSLPPHSSVTGNQYVNYLVTLYSQSRVSNRGTRGMDQLGLDAYVETALDMELLPAVLNGDFSLVVITGNAGDGKTAFLENLERSARARGAEVTRHANGYRMTLGNRAFVVNLDGSQDEEDADNDAVLDKFFASFEGLSSDTWKRRNETRLIAINEGRLVDYLQVHSDRYPLLKEIAGKGLESCQPIEGILVVNLNERCVVAPRPQGKQSIVEALVRRMTQAHFWAGCNSCDLRDRCYILHNARTFQDPKVSPLIVRRLHHLYFLTHLRGRLHITLRDLRSALAFMLTSNRCCDEVRALYEGGDTHAIAQSYYFNSWCGGDTQTADRLLTLLRDLDMGQTNGAHIDRGLDFSAPDGDTRLVKPAGRTDYADAILRRLFDELPRSTVGHEPQSRLAQHRSYVALCRRRSFFERRDDTWISLLPYKSSDAFGSLLLSGIEHDERLRAALKMILESINRGEGVPAVMDLDGAVALQVRRVDGGTIGSYRLFPGELFSLLPAGRLSPSSFIEYLPNALILTYSTAGGKATGLRIHLDLFEMFSELGAGYLPSIEQTQGCHLPLQAFKNVLSATPYQELLLTAGTGNLYRVERQSEGKLEMSVVSALSVRGEH